MRRLTRLVTAAAVRGVSTGDIISNSFAASTEATEHEAHPLLYHVPVLASRTVGREAEVRTLWQNLLAGRHLQVLYGMDGIGKSTIAAEFCDTVKHSQRFSCIQWFNGQHALASQLQHFFASMKGRKEKDVLLVVDDVDTPEAVIALIPEHPNVYLLMTTNAAEVPSNTKLASLRPSALSPQSSQQFVSELPFSDELEGVFHNLGYVPLLMHIASLMIAGEVCSPLQLRRVLEGKEVRKNDTLSISGALAVLLEICIAEMEKTYPDARELLRVISCFHAGDISDAVVDAVVGDPAGRFSVDAAQLGIFSLKWEENAFALHPLVRKTLQGTLSPSVLSRAAEALLGLWPRRWRGMGSQTAYNLVWHTYAICQRFIECQVPFTPSLITAMDRSAIFLAHVEARDLTVAVEMWLRIQHDNDAQQRPPSTESVRMLRECGRLLHFLKDARAEAVLQRSWKDSVTVHGRGAAESALILGCLAPYLLATAANMALVDESVAVLEAHLTSVDVVLGKEEVRMLWQTIFVLLMCKGQYMTELGLEIPAGLHRALERADAEVQKVK
ncbi:putative mitochondrial hypothetical protein [Leptomonas pyrrhocoris]|uniref:Uncharacterized protein n=1 Tax=Leptomonas pyrrhocoris TaxID=157538 RepID=A0A0N0DS06_LEPPY|nr:putative mitochondrial hypothetical protein [Leptomonas pyrrhocoris]KPA75418.1 putative mitochondrial hypothetical protein [Leptomonas pyrrhocoris]|eukprot:XP_015653857.1 putative mitochondrial hypothetical protein [Leptomonas pyrrhocoris]